MTSSQLFHDGPIEGVVLRPLRRHKDARGWLMEIFRQDELAEADWPAMAYISETQPGVARGPHEHHEQTDCFAFVGPGDFKLYLWDGRHHSATFGNRQVLPAGASNSLLVVVPPGVVHAYKNISDVPGIVFNAPNRLYAGHGRRQPVDEVRHENWDNDPYTIDDDA